jgi:hypothetical protein
VAAGVVGVAAGVVGVAAGVVGVAAGVVAVAAGSVPPVIRPEGAGLVIAGSEPFLLGLLAAITGCLATGTEVGP